MRGKGIKYFIGFVSLMVMGCFISEFGLISGSHVALESRVGYGMESFVRLIAGYCTFTMSLCISFACTAVITTSIFRVAALLTGADSKFSKAELITIVVSSSFLNSFVVMNLRDVLKIFPVNGSIVADREAFWFYCIPIEAAVSTVVFLLMDFVINWARKMIKKARASRKSTVDEIE